MKISDVMSSRVVCAEPSESLQVAACKMSDENVGSLPVTERGKLVGVITDRDIVTRAVGKGMGADALVQSAMTADVVTCSPDTLVSEAAETMRSKQIRRLYVTEDDMLAGVVSLGDLALETQTDESGQTLREISKP